MKPEIAIVGATGAVGSEFIRVIQHLDFEYSRMHLIASSRSAGKAIQTSAGDFIVQDIASFDFSQVKYAFFTAGGSVSREWAKIATDAGAIVIDNTSAFRMQPEVPLIVPEINAGAYQGQKLIANPNCSTIQVVRALAPIQAEFGINKVVASTYQAVSGAGNEGVSALNAGLVEVGESEDGRSPFPRPIAHNVIPCIDKFMDNGFTFEEEKVRFETRKILGLPGLFVSCTAVRVPVYRGHAVAVYIETDRDVDISRVNGVLEASGLIVSSSPDSFPTPRTIPNSYDVFVGRQRKEPDNPKGLWLWVVADNLWVGAALNAVRIAEVLENGVHVD